MGNKRPNGKYLVVVRTRETDEEKIEKTVKAIKEEGVEVTEIGCSIFERAFKLEGDKISLYNALKIGESLWEGGIPLRGLLPISEEHQTIFC